MVVLRADDEISIGPLIKLRQRCELSMQIGMLSRRVILDLFPHLVEQREFQSSCIDQ